MISQNNYRRILKTGLGFHPLIKFGHYLRLVHKSILIGTFIREILRIWSPSLRKMGINRFHHQGKRLISIFHSLEIFPDAFNYKVIGERTAYRVGSFLLQREQHR